MGLPNILAAVAKATPLGAGLSVLGAVGTAVTASGGKRKRHHRRRRLTNSDMIELTSIKNTLGKTAAAEALPFYLGRR